MKDFIQTKNPIESGNENILFQIGKILNKPGELDIKELKKTIFNNSFNLIEKWVNKKELQKNLDSIFNQLNQEWIDIKKIFKNESLENTILNISINYHIDRFKTTQSKIQKDIHFSKLYELLESFILRIIQKENKGIIEEDLMSAWAIWLLKSINSNYDPFQADFTTFCYMKIRKEIQDEKWKINSWYNIPNIHNYYYSAYAKIYKAKTWMDEIEYDEWVLIDTVTKLKKSNEGVTENLMKDIVFHRLNFICSLDNQNNTDEYWEWWSLLDTIESIDDHEDVINKIDNEILRNNLEKFLSRYPDYEKILLERKFGFDFWWDNTYPVYSIKVTRAWQEQIKEMIAIKWIDAIKRVKLLWYEVISTRKEVERTKRYETVVGWSLEKLKEYFEIKKLTSLSITALKKSETKIVKQLENYLTDILNKKWFENPIINIIV